MIASVRGIVRTVGTDTVIVEVGGVGLAVRSVPATLATMRRGEEAELATTLVVREDSLTLYGFSDTSGKDLFELVQSVSGVGPKIALALLTVLEPDELRTALATGDTASLTRAPGIGKKSADRLVLELREKAGVAHAAATTTAPAAGWRDRVQEALAGLGFTAAQAARAVDEVAADVDDPAVAAGEVGVLLRRALAIAGGRR